MMAAIAAGVVVLIGILVLLVVWMRRQSPSRDLANGLRKFQRGLDALDPANSPPHLRSHRRPNADEEDRNGS